MTTLTDRQLREIEYHREFARRHETMAVAPVETDVVTQRQRRWWNAYWHTYTLLRQYDLAGKTVLVPGCGFGADAVRLASMGARVKAFDISPEIIDITRRRLAHLGVKNVDAAVMPSEKLDYPDDTFDFAFFLDILHHVDIPKTMFEIRRVLKPGGRIIGDELYTHSFIQRKIRESYLVDKLLYGRMQRFIYNSDNPYITADEHKIDETEFGLIINACAEMRVYYFNVLIGRLLPDRWNFLAIADRGATATLGGLGRFFAGRVVFDGSIAK